MTTLIFIPPACLEHDTGPGHPESDVRLRELLTELSKPRFAGLQWRQAPRADRRQLARVHGFKYISEILASMPKQGRKDADITGTVVSPGSGEAALRAAGAVCAAIDAVMAGEASCMATAKARDSTRTAIWVASARGSAAPGANTP